MTVHFCTYFDVNYLTRALMLLESLRRHVGDFRLHVVAMDDRVLPLLGDPTEVVAHHYKTVLPEAVLALEHQRERVSFLWTCTPAVIQAALDRPEVDQVTYLDADLMFFADPAPILEEASRVEVLITEHRFTPRWVHLAAHAGRFCVQWDTFRDSERSRTVLRSWYEDCLGACSAVPENGQCGDQKYLDGWPEAFPWIGISNTVGCGIAPWNQDAFEWSADNGTVTVDGEPLVFYHFQGLRLRSDGLAHCQGWARVRKDVVELVYRPYLQGLRRVYKALGWSIADAPPGIVQAGSWLERGRLFLREARRLDGPLVSW